MFRCRELNLRRIGAENSTECLECGEHVDNTKHILSDSLGYEKQLVTLKSAVDGELTLHTLVDSITGKENERNA